MRESPQLVECVPNISQGRNREALARIIRSIEETPVRLLHVDTGYDANRTVLTFCGTLDEVLSGARQLFAACDKELDLRHHVGAHPYIGAVDVCPFIALEGISAEVLQAAIVALGEELASQYQLPVYLYEHSACRENCRTLPKIRRGGLSGLAARINNPEWTPDFGPSVLHPRLGASVLGHRELLIAYNINLQDANAAQAQAIAKRVRRRSPWLRAIAWEMPSFGCWQISTNLIRFWEFGLFDTYRVCEAEAAKEGLHVSGSELIGLVPLQALHSVSQKLNPNTPSSTDTLEAIRFLGLNSIRPFVPEKQIIENCLGRSLLTFPVQIDER